MAVAALVTWLITAVLGGTLLIRWATRGGVRGGVQSAGGGSAAATRLAPALVFGHLLLAVAGLVIWIVYLAGDNEALIWVAFALLVLVAVLGDVMFVRWLRSRREPTPESGLPTAVVYGHGLFAVVTAVLVLLVGLGVGD